MHCMSWLCSMTSSWRFALSWIDEFFDSIMACIHCFTFFTIDACQLDCGLLLIPCMNWSYWDRFCIVKLWSLWRSCVTQTSADNTPCNSRRTLESPICCQWRSRTVCCCYEIYIAHQQIFWKTSSRLRTMHLVIHGVPSNRSISRSTV
jgi:hypothetical protein